MSNALDHPCPVCGQGPGLPCVAGAGTVMPKPHYNRIPALEVRCPSCLAPVGQECKRIAPGATLTLSHWNRITRAQQTDLDNAGEPL